MDKGNWTYVEGSYYSGEWENGKKKMMLVNIIMDQENMIMDDIILYW